MENRVKLSCECGQVQGKLTVEQNAFFHIHCLCCDCQNYAAYLKNEHKILDQHGGTALFQTYPNNVEITQGIDQIASVQLAEKGLYRWYTRCCNTPVANTMTSAKMPFVGIPTKFMQFENEQAKLNALGPVTMKAFGKYAQGEMPADVHPRFPLSYMPKIISFMVKGMFKKKHQNSPFFVNGAALSQATLLSKANNK